MHFETHKRGVHDCGWVKKLELRNNDTELWAGFEITEPDVKDLVDRGTVKYTSSEIDNAWIDPELCRSKGDCGEHKVFEALALVNHPYIKNMPPVQVPINLSEDFGLEVSAGTARRKCSCQHEHDNHKGGDMPELVELEKGLQALEKKLEEVSKDAGGKAELSEFKTEMKKALTDQITSLRSSITTTQQELQAKEFVVALKELTKKRKLTKPVYDSALRIGLFMIRTGNAIVLAEKDAPVKLTLAEGAKVLGDAKEESLDKLDVIGEVCDMLGQLPDAIASRPEDLAKLEEDCEYPDGGKSQMSEHDKIEHKRKQMSQKDPNGFAKKDLMEQYRLAEFAVKGGH